MTELHPNFHARPILYDIRKSPDDFDTFTTSNNYTTPLYTWITTFMGLKIIEIEAADNDIKFKIMGSYDGVNYDITAQQETTLTANTTTYVHIPDFYASLQISAKSASTGKAGTVDAVLVATSHSGLSQSPSATGYESLPVTSSAAVSLTSSVYGAASAAVITVEDAPVRVRWDGVSPDISTGHLLQAGDSIELTSATDIRNFEVIATSTAAVIDVTYSR